MSTDLLSKTFLGNEIAIYLLALGTLVAGILLTQLIRTFVLSYLKKWAQKTSTDLDDRLLRLIQQPTIHLLYLGSVYLKYSDDSVDTAYSVRDGVFPEGELVTIEAASRIDSNPYQVNLRVGGLNAEGNTYTVSVQGCQ